MKLTAEQVQTLGEAGYVVADGFLGHGLVRPVRDAAVVLARSGQLRPAGVRRGAAHTLDPEVRSDRTCWVEPAEHPGPLAEAWACFEALRLQLNREAYLGLSGFELQLGWYPADGARYARHRDAFPGSDNRRVTAIAYLNEGWAPACGGQLRLHVEPPLLVEPVADRWVLFLSERVEHEVLESHADRFALTAWYRR